MKKIISLAIIIALLNSPSLTICMHKKIKTQKIKTKEIRKKNQTVNGAACSPKGEAYSYLIQALLFGVLTFGSLFVLKK